ncbi:MAG: DoxX family protein [Mangrovibacterium sp.]
MLKMKTGTIALINDLGLLILRVGIGASMLTHGIPKLQLLFAGGEIAFPDPLGIGVTGSLLLVVFAEGLCSVLLVSGLFTRLASVPLLINMAVAVFVIHGADPFAKKELAVLYLLVFLIIMVFGGGRFSLDRLIRRKP